MPRIKDEKNEKDEMQVTAKNGKMNENMRKEAEFLLFLNEKFF